MVLTIVFASIALVLTAGAVFLVARYLPIIVNLFLNVTVRRRPEKDEILPGEDVAFETADGVHLRGTLTPAPGNNPSAPVIVFCHEYTANRHTARKYAGFLMDAGFRIFAFDFRGHGDSVLPNGYFPRQWATEYELSDLRAALRYLRGRSDVSATRVGFFGMSRGAVTAIAVAADDPGVAGVVSDGAFCTKITLESYMRRWAPIFADVRKMLWLLPPFVFSGLRKMAIRFSEHRVGIRFVRLAPALRRLRTPILFIHGEEDSYLQMSQARTLFELAGDRKELWVVQGADHNGAIDAQPEEYIRRTTGFFRRTLSVQEARQPSVR